MSGVSTVLLQLSQPSLSELKSGAGQCVLLRPSLLTRLSVADTIFNAASLTTFATHLLPLHKSASLPKQYITMRYATVSLILTVAAAVVPSFAYVIPASRSCSTPSLTAFQL